MLKAKAQLHQKVVVEEGLITVVVEEDLDKVFGGELEKYEATTVCYYRGQPQEQ